MNSQASTCAYQESHITGNYIMLDCRQERYLHMELRRALDSRWSKLARLLDQLEIQANTEFHLGYFRAHTAS